MTLRRWKPFFDSFHHIDAAIESSSDDGLCRDEFRIAKTEIVALMCGVADEDGEGFCLLLDEAMVESLLTLRAVPPAKIARRTLASKELVGALGKLMREHSSERVRGLARDIVHGWRADVMEDLARARAAMDVLDGFLSVPAPPTPSQEHPTGTKLKKQTTAHHPITGNESISSSLCEKTEISNNTCQKRDISNSNTFGKKTDISNNTCMKMDCKKMGISNPSKNKKMALLSAAEEEKKIEATKRKLRDCYEEVQNMKRSRMIQVIEMPTQQPAVGTVKRRRQ